MLPRFRIERDLADGALEVVLPAWRPLPIDMSIVHYGPSAANPRVDLFASFVVSELAAR
jgi:DNA-binding transcriptional LysR family regulator